MNRHRLAARQILQREGRPASRSMFPACRKTRTGVIENFRMHCNGIKAFVAYQWPVRRIVAMSRAYAKSRRNVDQEANLEDLWFVAVEKASYEM